MARREKRWVAEFARYLSEYPRKVHSRAELDKILQQLGPDLGVPESLRVSRLITVLEEEAELHTVQVYRESRGVVGVERKTRYAWGRVSPYAIGAALHAGAYLSHASAMFLHALTDQVPKTIYVNREQSPKPQSASPLTQAAINRAFKRPPRKSSYVFVSEDARYVLLSGKHTGRLEVSPTETPLGELVDATKLERTLIDIAVRPSYSGGVREVLEAYTTAVPRVSLNTLVATLKKLDYVYPYHQAIGFLFERAGLPESQLEKLAALGLEWGFYLAHQISQPVFDSRWRVFYPEGL